MITIRLDKRYIGNGTTEPRREAKFRVKALKSCFTTGYTWHVIFENGKELDLLHSARGKDSFLKRELVVEYK